MGNGALAPCPPAICHARSITEAIRKPVRERLRQAYLATAPAVSSGVIVLKLAGVGAEMPVQPEQVARGKCWRSAWWPSMARSISIASPPAGSDASRTRASRRRRLLWHDPPIGETAIGPRWSSPGSVAILSELAGGGRCLDVSRAQLSAWSCRPPP